MSSFRVIDDSDDDGDGLSPAQSPCKTDATQEQMEEDGTAVLGDSLQKTASSTDPLVFQELYAANIDCPVNQSHDPPSSNPLPTLDDMVRGHTSITSPSTTCARKLKRSKTLHDSSLTSISEPNTSNKKVRRAKSAANIEALTQLTTPEKLNLPVVSMPATKSDIWEFPSSAAGEGPGAQVYSRSAEKEKKTYGKNKLKRSKTTEIRSGPATDWAAPTSSKDDTAPEMLRSRIEDQRPINLSPMLPPTKRRRNLTSETEGLPRQQVISLGGLQSNALSKMHDMLNSGSEPCDSARVQVPQSTSGETWRNLQPANPSIVASVQEQNEQINDSYIPSTDSGGDVSRISIMLPSTLSSSQKKQYEIMIADLATTGDSIHPGTMDTIPYSAASGVLRDITNESINVETRDAYLSFRTSGSPNGSKVSFENRSRSELTRGKERDRSYSASQEHPPSVDDIGLTTASRAKKLRRNKSTGFPSNSQESVDELSLSPIKLPSPRKGGFTENLKNTIPAFAFMDVGETPRSVIEISNAPDISQNDAHVMRTSKESYAKSILREKILPESLRDEASTSRHSLCAKAFDFGATIEIDPAQALATVTPDSITVAHVQDQPLPVKAKRGRPRKNLRAEDALVGADDPVEEFDAGNAKDNSSLLPDAEKLPSKHDTIEMQKDAKKGANANAPPKRRGRPRMKTMPVYASERIVDDSDDEQPVVFSVSRKRSTPMAKGSTMKSIQATEPEPATTPSKTVPRLPVPSGNVEQPPTRASPSETLRKNIEQDSPDLVGTDHRPKLMKIHETKKDKQTAESAEPGLKTPDKRIEKGPDKHSPLNTGKVSFRVGLSRKGRVPSLLKVKPKEPRVRT